MYGNLWELPNAKGQPWYGNSKKVRPTPKKRRKRNKPGFISMWHINMLSLNKEEEEFFEQELRKIKGEYEKNNS